jgi:hypothetical protein
LKEYSAPSVKTQTQFEYPIPLEISENFVKIETRSFSEDNIGTGDPPYNVTDTQSSLIQAITAMPEYSNYSFEELRVKDYTKKVFVQFLIF